MQLFFLSVVFCINAIIAEHFEVLFRDVYNKSFNEIKRRNTFYHGLIIFVPGVMKGNRITVIFINA